MTAGVLERPVSDPATPDCGGTLEELLTLALQEARTNGSAECPVCDARMTSTCAGAECAGCGSRLS
jgi:tRNA(Ile2) C34 agmatinyltransferase TiaS